MEFDFQAIIDGAHLPRKNVKAVRAQFTELVQTSKKVRGLGVHVLC